MIGKILDIIGQKDSTSKKASEEERRALEEEIAQLLMLEGAPRPEPDLRTLGLFADVSEERVAELIHAMLYLDETIRSAAKLSPSSFTSQPMEVRQMICSGCMILCAP